MIVLDATARAALPGLWACGLVVERTHEDQPTGLPEAETVIPPGLTLDNLKDHDTSAGFRRVSWAVGIDPTKNRPSGEALARRILNGNPPPMIHPLVDAYNLASAHTLVPLGAYDLDHARTPLTIRPAREGDTFHGIARDLEPLAPGRIAYFTEDGVAAGVLMWRDSMETRIRDTTERALIMAVGADPLDASVGVDALQTAGEYVTRVGFRATGSVLHATDG